MSGVLLKKKKVEFVPQREIIDSVGSDDPEYHTTP